MTLAEETHLQPPPPEPTHTVIGRAETDTFCANCHYNLHGLNVLLDSRLQLPVIRCPECGRYHAAGIASGAGRLWLNRLARFLLAAWVLFIIAFVLGLGFAMFLLSIIQIEAFTRYTPDVFIAHGAGLPVWTRRPMTPDDFGGTLPFLLAHTFFLSLCTAAGALLGIFLSTCISHVQRAWLLLAALLPPIAAASGYFLIKLDHPTRFAGLEVWATLMTTRNVAVEILALTVGIFFGRSISRFTLRILLPKRFLQYFRFLWEIDRLTPPSSTK